ncbi:HK97 family phage prohead protease [Lysobacter antibioticus]|uniref:HK97 family phage prohead protease n=1 Tax=Lysobacter antibioticus TaxID=84531 RepID=UPI0007E8BFA7|nr:HK97 family phage prohead protease [Lysobacter antibioticus]
MEVKRIDLESVDVKFLDSRQGVFAGYASKFGGVDSYGDTILSGAYKRTLKKRDRPIRLRWNHWGPVIGKWLEVREDDIGLYVEGELTPGHRTAEDVFASMKHGAVDGLSIGFRPLQFRDLGDGRRELKEIELLEISIVEEPADLGARVSDVKSALDEAESLKEIETILREAGRFSRADATALVARVKALARGERGAETVGAEDIRTLFQRFATG